MSDKKTAQMDVNMMSQEGRSKRTPTADEELIFSIIQFISHIFLSELLATHGFD